MLAQPGQLLQALRRYPYAVDTGRGPGAQTLAALEKVPRSRRSDGVEGVWEQAFAVLFFFLLLAQHSPDSGGLRRVQAFGASWDSCQFFAFQL